MAELQRKKQKSVGTICKDAIMTGISYMIPVIVEETWRLQAILHGKREEGTGGQTA